MVPIRRHARHWRTYLASGGLVLKQTWRRIIFWLLVAGLVCLPVKNSERFQHCIRDNKHHKPYNALDQKASSVDHAFVRLELNAACASGDTDALTALAGIAVAFFTFTLWRSTHLLWESGKEQAGISERAAKAAESAAAATLASLRRPWLILEDVQNTFGAWINADGILTVSFRIRNYGNAPALITSVTAVAFQGLVEAEEDALQDVALPPHWRDFPSIQDLDRFLNVRGTALWQSSAASAHPTGHKTEALLPLDRVNPIAISGDTTTGIFIARQWPHTRSEGAIELNANLYMLGRAEFSGPDDEPWTLTFCYVGRAGSRMQRFGRAPYNEKKRSARR